MDPRDQLFAVEGLGQVVVGPEAEPPELGFGRILAREDQDRRFHPGQPKMAQHVVARHVRQVQVQQNQVVVIELGEVDRLLAQPCRVDVEVGMTQHQLDTLCRGRIILDEQNAHYSSPFVRALTNPRGTKVNPTLPSGRQSTNPSKVVYTFSLRGPSVPPHRD
jgi:hypothetical protein